MAQLAKAVNQVLTKTYNLLYTEDGEDGEAGEEAPQLKLQTAPLASSEEVEKLFTSQIIDLETALPAALHALGATADEVERAMERGREKEQKKCDCEDEDRATQKQDTELNMKERALGLKKTEADMCADCQLLTNHAHTHACSDKRLECPWQQEDRARRQGAVQHRRGRRCGRRCGRRRRLQQEVAPRKHGNMDTWTHGHTDTRTHDTLHV